MPASASSWMRSSPAGIAVFVRPGTLRTRRLPLTLPWPIAPRQRPEHVRWNWVSRQAVSPAVLESD